MTASDWVLIVWVFLFGAGVGILVGVYLSGPDPDQEEAARLERAAKRVSDRIMETYLVNRRPP